MAGSYWIAKFYIEIEIETESERGPIPSALLRTNGRVLDSRLFWNETNGLYIFFSFLFFVSHPPDINVQLLEGVHFTGV